MAWIWKIKKEDQCSFTWIFQERRELAQLDSVDTDILAGAARCQFKNGLEALKTAELEFNQISLQSKKNMDLLKVKIKTPDSKVANLKGARVGLIYWII